MARARALLLNVGVIRHNRGTVPGAGRGARFGEHWCGLNAASTTAKLTTSIETNSTLTARQLFVQPPSWVCTWRGPRELQPLLAVSPRQTWPMCRAS